MHVPAKSMAEERKRERVSEREREREREREITCLQDGQLGGCLKSGHNGTLSSHLLLPSRPPSGTPIFEFETI